MTSFGVTCLLGAIGLGLILLCTVSSVFILISSVLKTKKNGVPRIYEDKDGIATEEATAAFSANIPRLIIGLLSFLGVVISSAIAILGTAGNADGFLIEDWLNAASWTLLLVQAVCIASSKVSIRTYELGIYSLISCAILLLVLFVQNAALSQKRSSIGHVAPFVLRLIELALTVLTAFANGSLPRRPTVFIDGRDVDSGETVSALNKYTFTWAYPLLLLAQKKGTLDLDDLPKPDHTVRAKDVTDAWVQANRSGRLWVRIALAHKWALMLQWFLTLLQAFGNFGPQLVLLNLLRLLEKRELGKPVNSQAWIWVLALGLTSIAASWIEAWMFWVSQANLTVPARAELSSLVFQKAMRRKDVKGDTKSKKEAEARSEDGPPSPSSKVTQKRNGNVAGKPKVKEDEEKLSQQSIINLIAVDSKRVSEFLSYNNFFIGTVFKLTVSFAFLLSLIGWQSLLAGFVVWLLIMPINIIFSKRYAAAQGRVMKVRDEKLGSVKEALQGLRQIKFMGIEKQWQEKILGVRTRELLELWESDKADTMLMFCWISSPILFSATSLAVYALVYGELTPSIAFTSIGVFKQLELALAIIPELTTMLIDAYVSVKRIEEYLSAPEIIPNTKDSPTVSFINASIAWPSDLEKEDGDQRYVLRDINVAFPNKELSVISGKTGTGKSLLLAGILGEVDLLGGFINVPTPPSIYNRHDQKATKDNWIIPSSIAFVAQIPWIENASIKDNILFGLPCDEYRYEKTIEVCALQKDLDMLPDGESTEIGANGINLSGGQRWRVTFARALYSRAGILVLDDIFSAVDAHVGRFIFENALTGELGVGRTRILVTHHVALCKSRIKYLVELGDGTVEHAGLLSELEEDGTLTKIMSHEQTAKEIEEDQESTAVNSGVFSDEEPNGEIFKKTNTKTLAKKFVEDETREKGAVSKVIYLKYIKSSGGWIFWSMIAILFLAQQAITLGRSWWLKIWTGSYEEASVGSMFVARLQTSFGAERIPAIDNDLKYYLMIYIIISLATSFLGTLKFFYVYVSSIKASKNLFEALTFTVLRTPLRWVDTVPLGRILNRFTADFNIIDSRIAMDIGFTASSSLQLIAVMIAGLFVSPWIIILGLILAAMCVRLSLQYLAGAREVKRLESNVKSPIFEQFGAALNGVATIRAFDNSEVYIERMYAKLNDWSATYWYLWLFNRWVGYRLSMVGSLFGAIVAALILTIDGISAALAGFALAFSLEFSGAIIWTIRFYTNLELDLNAAERIVEYSELLTEPLDGADPPAAWPTEGRLEVHDLVAGYAPELPPVLKGLTFSVEPNERIGVVGRTGAGKSSLTLALFRFIEAREGSIIIDGLDISKLRLQPLRSRLAIIPQDPVLFSGTIRTNLDAFDEHNDDELREALERVHLVSAPASPDAPANFMASSSSSPLIPGSPSTNQNINPFASLLSPITEGGLNLSQGQRQLLCLARAIVSRPKLMVLDEATSAVDMATDTLIQRSIREEFTDSTLIVIAHRLSTIADFDKIMVMSDGQVAEFGTPRDLLMLEDGAFHNMVKDSGEREVLENMILRN